MKSTNKGMLLSVIFSALLPLSRAAETGILWDSQDPLQEFSGMRSMADPERFHATSARLQLAQAYNHEVEPAQTWALESLFNSCRSPFFPKGDVRTKQRFLEETLKCARNKAKKDAEGLCAASNGLPVHPKNDPFEEGCDDDASITDGMVVCFVRYRMGCELPPSP